MDPGSVVIAAAATGVAKGAGSGVGRMILGLLAKRTQRWWIAWAVSRAAKEEGILIGWWELARWLKSADVRAALASGERDSLSPHATHVSTKVHPGGPSPEAVTARIVELVRDEALRRMSDGDGRVVATRRLENAIEVAANERPVLLEGGDETAFSEALEKLHPWRAEEAMRLAYRSGPFRALVITLATEQDRRSLLQQWSESHPVGLSGAPSEYWCWLASVAADYGATDAALAFVAKGVESGASASYWWARAGVMVGTATPADAARAQQLWARSIPKHPLAAAGEALVRGDFVASERFLAAWDVDKPDDQSIKAVLGSAAATGRGDYNRAIVIGLTEAEAQPQGSANALRAADALVARGHFRKSDHPLSDFARALQLAVRARDARRVWLGDSVAPILIAVKAAALSTDIDRAWRLTQPAPEGEALPHEAHDERLQRESVILAATMGLFETARSTAAKLEDPFISYMVEGWQALAVERRSDAEEAWLRAWDHAPNDAARMQAATALAPLGRHLPDLEPLVDDYSVAVDRIRTVHEVMRGSDGDVSLLRARAADSEELTVLLAERLMGQGDTGDAAAILEAGGGRWGHPLLTRMAAARYMVAGNYEKAYEVATTALALGGPVWVGRLDTLMIQFDSLEAQGEFTRSLAVAREMVALAPANLTVRWAFIHSLVRDGRLADAWSALTYEGKPVAPRDPGDARTWIGLAAECDNSVDFVQRALAIMAMWSHEPDLVGVFLLQIYRGLQRHERDVAETDLHELHRATEEFTTEHPESPVFQRLEVDENDPLAALISLLKKQSAEDPEIRSIRERIQEGVLPLGLATEIYNRTYLEVCIRSAAGLVYSHHPGMATEGQIAAAITFGKRVAIDASAAATLSLLDPAVVDLLRGAFLALETTDSAFRDALNAQQSLNMLSTMSLGWDQERDRPLIAETSRDDAEALARRSDRVVHLLARSERRGWPGLKRFSEFSGQGVWLSTLDLAVSMRRAFWCDDRVLRQFAVHEGAQTFGTIDLVAALEAAGGLEPALGAALRARLVAAHHVDLDFDLDVVTLAAEMDGWMPKGAAATLARVHSWTNPNECLRFATKAMLQISTASPAAIRDWTAATALGLVRISEGNPRGASGNLRILLTVQFAQPWLRPDTLPFVMDGIRNAVAGSPEIEDPLRPVLTRTYSQMAERHGAAQAAEFILMLVKNLPEKDRMMAANIILTTNV